GKRVKALKLPRFRALAVARMQHGDLVVARSDCGGDATVHSAAHQNYGFGLFLHAAARFYQTPRGCAPHTCFWICSWSRTVRPSASIHWARSLAGNSSWEGEKSTTFGLLCSSV